MRTSPMHILVVGATGGSGRAVVEALLRAGQRVTAFSRSADRLLPEVDSPLLHRVSGDATNPADVDRVVPGHDAIIVTLGISENALGVRLRGARRTPMDVRSAGTRNVIAAMRRHGVRRLVVQSSYGVGATRDRLRFVDRLLFRLLLQPQIADTEVQEEAVTSSAVDWVIAQPVHLTDDDHEDAPFASRSGDTRGMKVSRRQVARFLVDAARTQEFVGCSVALSA